jgi:hypothetical protein
MIRLTCWLEETFATQLLLSDDRLQEKNSKKKESVKSDLERAYRGLYHDNGSCLDITNDIDPEHKSYLQIIQACDSSTDGVDAQLLLTLTAVALIAGAY